MGTDSLDADALYRAHVRPLYLFIYGKVGNREAAEDLTSEVFVKALTHLDSSREERSIVAWLYRVARNAVADYWRAGTGARVIALDEARLTRAPAPPPEAARGRDDGARHGPAGAVARELSHRFGLSFARGVERGRDSAAHGYERGQR